MNIVNQVFGPLSNNSCTYFLIVGMFFFVMLSIVLLSEIYFILTKFNQLNIKVVGQGIIVLFNLFLAYFVNRLLYTMCNKTLA